MCIRDSPECGDPAVIGDLPGHEVGGDGAGVGGPDVYKRQALVGLADEPGIAFKIFSLLAKNRINVDIILQSIGRDSSKDISFTVARGDTERAKALLEEHREAIGFREIEVNEQVAKVSIVGAGMVNNRCV